LLLNRAKNILRPPVEETLLPGHIFTRRRRFLSSRTLADTYPQRKEMGS
jgi:hypothetical protein